MDMHNVDIADTVDIAVSVKSVHSVNKIKTEDSGVDVKSVELWTRSRERTKWKCQECGQCGQFQQLWTVPIVSAILSTWLPFRTLEHKDSSGS